MHQLRFVIGRQERQWAFRIEGGVGAEVVPWHPVDLDACRKVCEDRRWALDGTETGTLDSSAAVRDVGDGLARVLEASPDAKRACRFALQAAHSRGPEKARSVVEFMVSCSPDLEEEHRRQVEELPWELVRDRSRSCFVSALAHAAVWRLIDKPRAASPERPVRILVVLPTPVWTVENGHYREWSEAVESLSVVQLIAEMQGSTEEPGAKFTLLAGRDATVEELRHELGSGHDILLYVGHGRRDRQGRTRLLFDQGGRTRRGQWLSQAAFVEMVGDSGLHAVVLSACDSVPVACALARLGGLDAVVGMQCPFPVLTGEVFDGALLRGLAAWQPVGSAVHGARQAVAEYLRLWAAERGAPDDCLPPDWAIPVLFAREQAMEPDAVSLPAATYVLGLHPEEEDLWAQDLGESEARRCLSYCARQQRTADLDAFRLARWPVTNQQYAYYLEYFAPRRQRLPKGFELRRDRIRLQGLNPTAPVVNVTCEEAASYCRWAGGRLPTADELEAATRGPGSGDAWRPPRGGSGSRHPAETSVLHFPGDSRGQRMHGLCGQVEQWTATSAARGFQLVYGGHPQAHALLSLPASRCPRVAAKRYSTVGFRCAFDPA